MNRIMLLVAGWLLLASLGRAQVGAVIGVSGTTLAGTSFTLRIDATTAGGPLRDIDFVTLPINYEPFAMAQLMVDRINEDFRAHDETGFTADRAAKADGRKGFDANFVIDSSVAINDIMVGMLGSPNIPIPRPPGVGFNPNILFYQSTQPPFPYIGAQVGSPTANLTLNGLDPANHFRREVEVFAGGNFDLAVSSGPSGSVGFLLLAGPLFLGSFQLPWGDLLDLGVPGSPLPTNVSLIGDGISFLTGTPLDLLFHTDVAGAFLLSLIAPPSLAGQRGPGLQVLVQDPTSLPFGLRFTQAVNPHFEFGQEVVLPLANDGVAPFPFQGANDFPFYGNSFNQVFVHENGLLTFAAPAFGGGQMVDPLAFSQAPFSSIFVNWSNWEVAPTAGAGIVVREFGDEVRVGWGLDGFSFSHLGDVDTAAFECVLRVANPANPNPNAGAVFMDFISLDPASVIANDGVVGLSPGNGLDPTPESIDLGLQQFGVTPMSSLLEQERLTTSSPVTASVLPASGSMQVQEYNDGTALSGRHFGFFPPTGGLVPIQNRYFSIPSDHNPDAFVRVRAPAQLSVTAVGPQTLVLVGFFEYLVDLVVANPPVLLDPMATVLPMPRPLDIVGIMNGQTTAFAPAVSLVPSLPVAPGFRDFEGLVVSLNQPLPPNLPVGTTLDISVGFDPMNPIIVPAAVTVAP